MTARSSYIPPYIKDNLKWYEKEGLITYFQQREYQEFKKDRDAYINETKILNFDIIHHMCRGDKLEKTIKEHNTVKKERLKQMPPSEKYTAVAACFRSSNKNIIIERSIAKEYFSCNNSNICRTERNRLKKQEQEQDKNRKYFECW